MSQQLFKPGANNLAKVSILAGGLITALVLGFILVTVRSPFTKAPVGIPVPQPVRFSHELHAGTLNVDCRYCHSSAEVSSYAGIPDTHTCMSCHSQIATYSELLEPVRNSYASDERLVWNRVHAVGQYVYFNHSAHLNGGIGCETCHGRIDQMPIVWRNETMTMRWCLDCHFEPEKYIRPLDEVYTMGWTPPIPQSELGPQLVAEYDIHKDGLTDCAVCHR